MFINTNVSALVAQHRLGTNTQNLNKSLERLSSGYRINRASDDAAGYTISQNLTNQIVRMKQAGRNTQDGISVLQVAEGVLSVIGESLQRVRELTVQAANDINSTANRTVISNEVISLLQDIDRIAASTTFNSINLLDGSVNTLTNPAVIQIGPGTNAASNVVDISAALTNANATGLGLVAGGGSTFATVSSVSLSTHALAQTFLADIDVALAAVNTRRTNIGAFQNRLESVTNNLDMAVENFSASNSRIKDVDVAAESSDMVKSQILTEAATTVLAQTNNLPRLILSLLQQQ